jgi:hypothetical protein
VAVAEVVDQADPVGDVLVELERDQRVVDPAVGQRPKDDPGGEAGDDRRYQQPVGAGPGGGGGLLLRQNETGA